MKRKEEIITYILMVVMCIGITIGSFLGDAGEIISTVITSVTAVISAVAVYIQMKKDKEISQAEFLLEFSKFFYTFEGAQRLEEKIDRAVEQNRIYKVTSDDYEEINGYMLWLEALASMVINKTLSIKLINNMYNYRFFAVINNPTVQQSELAVFGTYYRNIFKLHKIWSDYRRANGQEILYEEYDLSKLPGYNEVCAGKQIEVSKELKKKSERTYANKKN